MASTLDEGEMLPLRLGWCPGNTVREVKIYYLESVNEVILIFAHW